MPDLTLFYRLSWLENDGFDNSIDRCHDLSTDLSKSVEIANYMYTGALAMIIETATRLIF